MERLPPELCNQIVAFLPREEVPTIRQVSRYIERSCFDHFAYSFFRKRGFCITTDSLKALQCISQNVGLRKHVQHIWFNPDCFTFVDNPFWISDSDEGEASPLVDEDQVRKAVLFDKYVNDHRQLLYTAKLQTILTTIFESLPMLKTIGMRRGDAHKPYLWRTMSDEVGLDPRVLGSEARLYARSFADPTYLFIAIVKALATSRRRIRRLYTDAIQIDHFDESLVPSEADCKQAFRSIQYLEVNATGPPEQRDLEGLIPVGTRADTARTLEMILGSIPELYEIGMTIFRDPKLRHMIPPDPRQLQSWAQAYPYQAFQSISSNVTLQHLRRVKLEKLCTTAEDLCGFLRSCSPVLMSLKLRYIQLLHDGSNVLEAWQGFFNFLHEACSSIEYLLLHDLTCNGSSIRFKHDHLVTAEADTLASLTLELIGNVTINTRLSLLAAELTHGARVLGHAMNDAIWYTDTSDEDW